MPSIIVPRQHIVQPQGRVQSQSELYGLPLLASYDPGLQTPNDLSVVGSAVVSGNSGLYRSFPSGEYASVDDEALSAITNACTWVWRGIWVSGANFLFGNTAISGIGYNAGIYSSGANFPVFYVRTGSVVTAQQSVALVSGAEVTLVGTYDGATVRLYRDGNLVASNSQTGNVATGSGTHITFNRWNTGSPSVTRVLFGRVFKGAFTAEQVRDFTGNPWQLFRRDPVRLYFDVPSGGTVTGSLSATEGTVDTFSSAGDVLISGTFSATETTVDVFAASGNTNDAVTGTLSATESTVDVFASSGTILVSGSLTTTESTSDTASISGDVYISGTLAATEGTSDVFFATNVAPAANKTVNSKWLVSLGSSGGTVQLQMASEVNGVDVTLQDGLLFLKYRKI